MKRALAIFAKTPNPGQVKTRLSPPLSPEQSAALYRCMLIDTINRMSALNVDTFIFYEGDRQFFEAEAPGAVLVEQHEGGLGRRLEEALDTLASMGYGAKVVIGTDAPDLPPAYVKGAFESLEANDAVFGPATDGGYYLVAVRGGYGALFSEIPWSSDAVLRISLERAESSSMTSFLLPTWSDVDSFEDLLRPELRDPSNGAPLTRAFLAELGLSAGPTADAI